MWGNERCAAPCLTAAEFISPLAGIAIYAAAVLLLKPSICRSTGTYGCPLHRYIHKYESDLLTVQNRQICVETLVRGFKSLRQRIEPCLLVIKPLLGIVTVTVTDGPHRNPPPISRIVPISSSSCPCSAFASRRPCGCGSLGCSCAARCRIGLCGGKQRRRKKAKRLSNRRTWAA